MKKVALGLAMASFAFGGVASAREVRPTAVSLAPVGAQAALAAPAKAAVAKKNKAAGGLLLPILGGIALVGLVVAVASGDFDAIAEQLSCQVQNRVIASMPLATSMGVTTC